jgi:uncharacterized membrane protein
MCAMEFRGIPLHPLIIHAAVVLVPLAALSALLFAVPKWRWLTRWPAVVLAVIGALTVQLAVMSGRDLEKDRNLDSPLIHTHEEWGERLQIAMWIFAVIMVVAFWALPYVTRVSGAANRESRAAALETPLAVLVAVAAIAVLVLVVLTGDAGARAVWS